MKFDAFSTWMDYQKGHEGNYPGLGPSDPQEHQKPPGKVQCDVNLINCKLVWEFAQPKYTVRPLFEYLATLTVLLKGPCVEIKF